MNVARYPWNETIVMERLVVGVEGRELVYPSSA